ncbi:MAG: efflux RND transporter periplasmic adaptor subunit [Candidatus Gastranaerophilales bacterium]|nr:efflux RND transporter periplasmic adaptor subunit [Candidatus Gastranaerophilales bacterium]
MRKKIIIFISVLFAAIFVRFAISAFNTHMAKVNMSKVATPEVLVQSVGSKKIIKHYEAPARVVSKYQVNVEARINGYLQKSYFKEGDYVKAGQVLFEIEPQEYQYAMQQAKAEYTSAKAMQLYYDKQCARAKQLVQQDYIAKADYDNAVAQRDSYRAGLARTASIYNDAKRNLSYTKIKAPVSGRVGMITVTVGNYVSMNAGPLTTLNSTNPIYVTFPLEATYFNELARIDGSANVKRKVEFLFSSGQKYQIEGVQDFYDNKVDESTGTIKMRATFNNVDDQLISGDYGKIIIYSTKTTPVPIVPSKAIQDNQEGKYVYKMDENNMPQLTYVKIDGIDGDNSIILSGLEIGDRIIVGGIQEVIPGVPVKIVNELKTSGHKDNFFKKVLRKMKRIIRGIVNGK